MSEGHNINAQLKAIVERIENVDAEIDERNNDKRDIYAEAKGNGYDVPALKAVIRLRRQDPQKRRELETVVDTYRAALGMLD